jgi:hypothetical protein
VALQLGVITGRQPLVTVKYKLTFAICYTREWNIEYGSCEYSSASSGSVKGGTLLDYTEAAERSLMNGRDGGPGVSHFSAFCYLPFQLL